MPGINLTRAFNRVKADIAASERIEASKSRVASPIPGKLLIRDEHNIFDEASSPRPNSPRPRTQQSPAKPDLKIMCVPHTKRGLDSIRDLRQTRKALFALRPVWYIANGVIKTSIRGREVTKQDYQTVDLVDFLRLGSESPDNQKSPDDLTWAPLSSELIETASSPVNWGDRSDLTERNELFFGALALKAHEDRLTSYKTEMTRRRKIVSQMNRQLAEIDGLITNNDDAILYAHAERITALANEINFSEFTEAELAEFGIFVEILEALNIPYSPPTAVRAPPSGKGKRIDPTPSAAPISSSRANRYSSFSAFFDDDD